MKTAGLLPALLLLALTIAQVALAADATPAAPAAAAAPKLEPKPEPRQDVKTELKQELKTEPKPAAAAPAAKPDAKPAETAKPDPSSSSSKKGMATFGAEAPLPVPQAAPKSSDPALLPQPATSKPAPTAAPLPTSGSLPAGSHNPDHVSGARSSSSSSKYEYQGPAKSAKPAKKKMSGFWSELLDDLDRQAEAVNREFEHDLAVEKDYAIDRLRDAEQEYESQREEYERQRRYVDSYFAQVETNTPAATFDSSSSSSTTTTKKTSGVSGSAGVSTEQQFVYKRLDMPAEPAPENDITALLIGKPKQKDTVHWFYKQYKEEIPSLETPGTKQPGAKGVGAGPELEAPEYYSRRPPGGYGAYPGYDMYKHYEPKQYEPKGYERPGPGYDMPPYEHKPEYHDHGHGPMHKPYMPHNYDHGYHDGLPPRHPHGFNLRRGLPFKVGEDAHAQDIIMNMDAKQEAEPTARNAFESLLGAYQEDNKADKKKKKPVVSFFG